MHMQGMRGKRGLSRLAFVALTTAVVLGSLTGAHADVIHLNTGGVVKGEIVSDDDYEVRVRTKSGMITVILREDIERIERGDSPEQVYRKKLAKIDSGDVEAHYELAMWAKKIRLGELAKDEFNKVIILDPGHPYARAELGYVRNGKGWSIRGSDVVEGAEDEDLDLDSFVADASRIDEIDGEDPFSDRRAARDADRAEKAADRARNKKRSALLKGSVPDEARKILKDIKNVDAKIRKGAYDALAGLEDSQTEIFLTAMLGDSDRQREQAFATVARSQPSVAAVESRVGAEDVAVLKSELEPVVRAYVASQVVKPVHARVESVETTVVRQIERNQKTLLKLMKDFGSEQAKERRMKVLTWWEDSREEALKTIFDKSIYPDENHGRVGQPTVDEKVEKVRGYWEFYEKLVEADIGRFMLMTEAQAKMLLAANVGLQEVLADSKSFLASVERTAEPRPAPELPAIFEALLRYRSGDIDGAWKVATRLDKWEKRLLIRLRDKRIYEWNTGFASRDIKEGKRPSGEEIRQVEVTNDYRRMMGRIPLEVDTRLIQCARGHSAEMTQLGYFAHESPNAKNRSPSDRARNAGYPQGVSENISMGSITPEAAHNAWYNSSGHHRNILGPRWLNMGAGKDGKHWTQNFGSIQALKR